MNFLMHMCFICLKSKNGLTDSNIEILTKLLYFVDKTNEFLPPIFNHSKICNDCLDNLSAAFRFKKMCLNNIVHLKNYISQLAQVRNNSNLSTIMAVQLTGNKLKGALKVQEFVDSSLKQYSGEQSRTTFIKEEISDEIYSENCENSESQKVYSDRELKPLPYEEIKERWQNEFTNESNAELIDIKLHKIQDESSNLQHEQHSDKQIEKALVKTEILEENSLQSCEVSESKNKNSNKALKLLLHKEEILDDVLDEELQNKSKKIERGSIQSDESSKIENNEGSVKNKLLFICAMCDKHFTLKSKLRSHVRIHKKSHCCDRCQKYFTTKYALKEHTVIHSKERPYSCSVCMKTFPRKNYLKYHARIHFNERPFSCSVCKKSFTFMSSLKKHEIIHSNERPYSCPVCKENFSWKGNLQQHMLSHYKERRFPCSVCTKSFIMKSHLNRHLLIHSNERPHSCSICMKKFTQKGSLNQHVLIHSNKRAHSCSICMKKFIQKCNLKTHLLIHSKERP